MAISFVTGKVNSQQQLESQGYRVVYIKNNLQFRPAAGIRLSFAEVHSTVEFLFELDGKSDI